MGGFFRMNFSFGGKSEKECFSHYGNNCSLNTCSLTIGGVTIKILPMRLFGDEKV